MLRLSAMMRPASTKYDECRSDQRETLHESLLHLLAAAVPGSVSAKHRPCERILLEAVLRSHAGEPARPSTSGASHGAAERNVGPCRVDWAGMNWGRGRIAWSRNTVRSQDLWCEHHGESAIAPARKTTRQVDRARRADPSAKCPRRIHDARNSLASMP